MSLGDVQRLSLRCPAVGISDAATNSKAIDGAIAINVGLVETSSLRGGSGNRVD